MDFATRLMQHDKTRKKPNNFALAVMSNGGCHYDKSIRMMYQNTRENVYIIYADYHENELGLLPLISLLVLWLKSLCSRPIHVLYTYSSIRRENLP